MLWAVLCCVVLSRTKGLNTEEQLVYQEIRAAGNKGEHANLRCGKTQGDMQFEECESYCRQLTITELTSREKDAGSKP